MLLRTVVRFAAVSRNAIPTLRYSSISCLKPGRQALFKDAGLSNFTVRQITGHIERQPQSEDFFLRQLFDRESCTYSYLLGDTHSRDAVIIDPVVELIERDLETVQEIGFDIKYALSTHMHSDHVMAASFLKKRLPNCKTVISAASGASADILVRHGDILRFGRHKLEVRATPGHTKGCVTYICHAEAVAFTGDTLLIRSCGRTDLQQGDPESLYDSIFNQIFSLPNAFRLYPGHDYRGRTVTTVLEEKRYNPRLNRSKSEFIQLMKTMNHAYSDHMMGHTLLGDKELGTVA